MLLIAVLSAFAPVQANSTVKADVTSSSAALLAPELRLAAPSVSAFPPATGNFALWQQQAKNLLHHALLLPPADPVLIAAATRLNPASITNLEQWRLPLWQPLDLYLYKPAKLRQGAINAVILLHDHGAEFRIGKDKWLPPALSDQPQLVSQWQQKYFDGMTIAELLRAQGYLVLLADAPGFGARGPIQYAEQQQLAANLQAQGASLAGLMAREDEAAAAFLARQPGVTGIAAVGFSMGGFRAWQLAAISADVNAAVSVGWFNSLKFLREPGNNFSRGQTAFYMIHPGLYRQMDLPDIAALAAPKPLLLLHGEQDPLMPPAEVNEAFQQLKNRYQQCGAPAPELVIAKGQGHRFGDGLQQEMLHWLAQLQLADLQLPGAGCSN
ncbi:dienelactone hydrolase family protein [Rheinheimera texasensis]|uniref:dienelactone hydrolase family protein n=1 Tax=Rheinheimera texasensis TaxID=306205 RepID=UPI00146F972A|nr:dienelactone hydrolase family protein [Rheinheimera texasensis]